MYIFFIYVPSPYVIFLHVAHQVRNQLQQIAQERLKAQERLTMLKKTSHRSLNDFVSVLAHTTLFLKGILPHDTKMHKKSKSSSPIPEAKAIATKYDAEPRKVDEQQAQSQPKLTPYQTIFAAKRAERIRLGMEKLFELSGVPTEDQESVIDPAQAAIPTTMAADKIVTKFKNVQKLNKSFRTECKSLESKITDLRGHLQSQEKAISSSLDSPAGISSNHMVKISPTSSPTNSNHDDIDMAIRQQEIRCVKYKAMSMNAQETLDQLKVSICSYLVEKDRI